MTYEELRAKLLEGDPIADPDNPDKTFFDETGITILGGLDNPPSMAMLDDLHIALLGNKFVLRWRDNQEAQGDDRVWDTSGPSRGYSITLRICTHGSVKCEDHTMTDKPEHVVDYKDKSYIVKGGPTEQVLTINAHTPKYKMNFHDGETGKTASITTSMGKVVYQGDLPVDESADIFFRHVLMKWRDFGKDEDYTNARIAALEAGYPESDRLAAVVRDLSDTRDLWKLVLETVRFEARQEDSERLQRILKMVERTLGIRP